MEEVKYIPGDLVMTNGAPIGTKEGVVYVITACDPDRTVTLEKCGTVLKGTVTLDAIEKEDRWYFVPTSTWVKHIVPIPLTPEVLEKNGWREIDILVDEDGSEHHLYENKKNLVNIMYVPECKRFLPFIGNQHILTFFKYVHQLQHLLFGLGLPMDLKV